MIDDNFEDTNKTHLMVPQPYYCGNPVEEKYPEIIIEVKDRVVVRRK